jgi:phage baseplate assembly protein W|tara:strand:+ start:236 stop:652 length:417 start_codon:yes stop_codon:yes gene_type:complete
LSVLEKDLDPDVKIGISLPMDHTDGSGFFPGTSTTLTQTSSNIRNLLLTNKGERVGQPEFGCGLLNVLFEPMSDDLLEDVRTEIEDSIAFWLPHVTINNIGVDRDEAEPQQLNIIIEFALTIQPTVHEVITLNFLVGE